MCYDDDDDDDDDVSSVFSIIQVNAHPLPLLHTISRLLLAQILQTLHTPTFSLDGDGHDDGGGGDVDDNDDGDAPGPNSSNTPYAT